MKQFLKTAGIIVFALFLSSCAEEQPEIDKSFYIEFVTECGWCAGQEYIKVTEQKVLYTLAIPCGENEGTTTDSRNLTAEEWQEIIDSFDYDQFLTLNYNECNVCVDGCDEIIRINEEDEIHELRYSPGEEIQGMENLKTRLKAILEEFSSSN